MKKKMKFKKETFLRKIFYYLKRFVHLKSHEMEGRRCELLVDVEEMKEIRMK
jgi:hypothetical protein